jgi:hypothetical protein
MPAGVGQPTVAQPLGVGVHHDRPAEPHPTAGQLVTIENSSAERAAHAEWRTARDATWTGLFPDVLSRLVVSTDENRLDALVRFFHARMRAGSIR